MKVQRSVSIGVFALAAAGLLALPASAGAAVPGGTAVVVGKNLVVNGGFAVPNIGTNPYAEYLAGNPIIKGWAIGGSGLYVIGTHWCEQPPGYTQSIDLNPNGNGSISQSVPTRAGVQYALGWWGAGGDPGYGGTVRAMHILWNGKLVDSLTFSTAGRTLANMGWAHGALVVTATSSSSSLVFADASPPGLSGYGAEVGGVTLNAETIFESVNGFRVQKTGAPVTLSGPYGMAELQMLAKLPASAPVTAEGSQVATLTAASAYQSPAGTGLVLTWGEAPTSSFLQSSSAQQSAGAAAVLQYLSTLLKTSYSAYQAALQAERIAPGSSVPLTKSWGVKIEGVSTSGKLMTFEIGQASPPTGTITYSEAGVPTFSGTLTAASAPSVLRDMLYYTKSIAAAPGGTTTTTT